MRLYLADAYGNPSSGHWAARPAKVALERAREEVAVLLGRHSDEVVFTSLAVPVMTRLRMSERRVRRALHSSVQPARA